MMKSKSQTDLVLGVITAAIIAAGTRLFTQGPLGETIRKPESQRMFLELAGFFFLNMFLLSRKKTWHIGVGVLASCAVFCWLHQMLIPLLISGIYLGVIALGGRAVRIVTKTKNWAETFRAGILLDFLVGYAVWILLVCLLSAMKLGAIEHLRIAVLILGAGLLVWAAVKNRTLFRRMEIPSFSLSLPVCFGISLFLAFWMIQIGRANIAMDYDSLHYGLRSAYILDNGYGIYEQLGNINLVYTYSKGFEILGLPLAGSVSYGYMLAMNLWITALVLVAVSIIAGMLAGKKASALAVLLAAGTPGIMNMAITAKSDNLTLLFQCLCIYGLLQCVKRKSTPGFLIALCAYILTLTLKPTAIVFSTVLFGVGTLYLLLKEKHLFFNRLSLKQPWWILNVIAAMAWLFVWARTFRLTGVPITSIFTGILERIGFQVRHPFSFMQLPSNGTSLSIAGSVRHLFARLYGVLLAPVGEDMAHVMIAWGGSLVTFLLMICLFSVFRKGKSRPVEKSFMALLTLAVGIISLVSLYLLWQVDGNYYQLFYVLIILFFVTVLDDFAVRRRGVMVCMVPLLCFQLLITSLTNWAGVAGMSPVSWRHRGYYNHREANQERMVERGNAQIWSLLAADPTTRVVGFGEHPRVLGFPCNIQSYYDVTGSGGNVWLVKKLDYFKDFLHYAGTQYIYVEYDYLEAGSRAEEVVRFMIEDGSLRDIVYEHGNLLGRVTLEGAKDEQLEERCRQELSRYDEQYGR